MTGLDVLSALRGKGISGSDSSSSGQEKDAAEKELSAGFAGIFQQWLFALDGLKGQDSGEVNSGGATKDGLQKLFDGLLKSSQIESSFQNFFPPGKVDNSGEPASLGNGLAQRLIELGLFKFGSLKTELNSGQTGIGLTKSAENNNLATADATEYKKIIDLLEKLSGELQVISSNVTKQGNGLKPAFLQVANLAGKADTAAQPAQIIVSGSNNEIVQESAPKNIQGFSAEPEGDKNSSGQKESGQDNNSCSAAHKDGLVEDSGMLLTDNSLSKSLSTSAVAQNKPDNLPSAARAVKVSVWEQIAAGIQHHAFAPCQEIKGFEIQLYPENLGKIKLNLHWEGGQVHIQCRASEVLTLDLLQQNLGQLRESLQESGISCGMMQMGLGEQPRENKPKYELKLPLQVVPEEEEESLSQAAAYRVSKMSEGHQINLTA
jgi:hypothetical protein